MKPVRCCVTNRTPRLLALLLALGCAGAAWGAAREQEIERYGAMSFEQIRALGRNDPDLRASRPASRDLKRMLRPVQTASRSGTNDKRTTGSRRGTFSGGGLQAVQLYRFDLDSFDCNDIWYDGERVKIGERDAVVLTLMMQQPGRERSSAMTVAFKCRDDEVVELNRSGFFGPLALTQPVAMTGFVTVTHPRDFEAIGQKLSESAKNARNRHRRAGTIVAGTLVAASIVVTIFTLGAGGALVAVGALLVGAAMAAGPVAANISGDAFQAISEWSGCYTFTREIDRTFSPGELQSLATSDGRKLLWHAKGTKCRFGHAGGKYEYMLGGRIVPDRSQATPRVQRGRSVPRSRGP